MQRLFRVKSTGVWCAPSYSAEGFPDNGAELAERVAAALELPTGSLEVVDVEGDDPRGADTSKWLHEPAAEAEPLPPPSKLDQLFDAIESAGTLADLQAMARAIRR